MNKLIYLVRHCAAEGQGAECPQLLWAGNKRED